MSTGDLMSKILAVPVGKVVDVLGQVLECKIKINIIEQNTVSAHKFVRKVTISANEFPVIKALVKFDSSVLPEIIVNQLLQKKDGIGDILTQNNIHATRNVISVNHNLDESKVSREYEIIHNGIVWFTIMEEIRLGNLGSYKNS